MMLSARRAGRCALVGLSGALLVVVSGCGGKHDDSNTTTLVPAVAVLGQADFTSFTGNRSGKTPDANTLSGPIGDVAAAADGSLFYIADTSNSRILGFAPVPAASGASGTFVIGQNDFTSGMANSGTGSVLAKPKSVWIDNSTGDSATPYFVVADTDNNRVLIWNKPPSGNTPPDLVVGQANFVTKTAGVTASTLTTPTAAIIAQGELFVVDQGNNRVLIWDSVAKLEAAFASGAYTAGVTPPADEVLGQSDFISKAVPATPTANSMSNPTDVWSDGYSLFVSDTGDNRVLYWTSIPTAPGAPANFVLGQSTFTYNPLVPPASAGTMYAPTGIFSTGGDLFVADTGNNRVLIFDQLPETNGALADAIIGQEDFTHNAPNDDNGDSNNPQDGQFEPNPTMRTLKQPNGVDYYNGNLYVTDSGNNRVLLFNNLQYNGVIVTN